MRVLRCEQADRGGDKPPFGVEGSDGVLLRDLYVQCSCIEAEECLLTAEVPNRLGGVRAKPDISNSCMIVRVHNAELSHRRIKHSPITV